MTYEMQTALLTTVNAPYQNCLDASAVSADIKQGEIAIGQVGSFYTETSVDVQMAFAHEFDISTEVLTHVAGTFTDWSGQAVSLLT